MNTTPIQAIGQHVCVLMNDREAQTKGGIVIPEAHQKPNVEGTIVSIGNDVLDVSVGDTVGFPQHLGTRVEYGGKDLLLIEYTKLLYVYK